MRNLLSRLSVATLLLATAGAGLVSLAPSDPIAAPAASDRDVACVAQAIDGALSSGEQQTEGVLALPADSLPADSLPADSLLVCRRLSLALCGTIPSLEEIRVLQSLPDQQRVDRHLENLLADRRSADYLAERLARALVGDEDGPFLVYRRRRFVNWLSDQLAENRPYDALVSDVLADQGLWTGNPATNFVTVALRADERRPDANQLAVRVSRALLGIQLDCAQCHDHPFDERWKQHDFEQLAAFFGSTGFGQDLAALRGIGDDLGPYMISDSEGGELRRVEPRVPFADQLASSEGTCRQQLASWLTDPGNPAFARATCNRLWNYLLGKPLWDPVDDIPLELDSSDPASQALDLLARDFSRHAYDVQRLIRVIAATHAFRAESRSPTRIENLASRGDEPKPWALFPVTRLRGEQVVGSVLQAGALKTIDYGSPLLARIVRQIRENDFIERYGDAGARELEADGGSIPQRLLLMNGRIVSEAFEPNPLVTSAGRIALLAGDDDTAVETAFLVAFTRSPTAAERAHFVGRLDSSELTVDDRAERMSDLFWTLVNSTEFSWNH